MKKYEEIHGQIGKGLKHLRNEELCELKKIVDTKYPKLSEKVDKTLKRVENIEKEIRDFKKKT